MGCLPQCGQFPSGVYKCQCKGKENDPETPNHCQTHYITTITGTAKDASIYTILWFSSQYLLNIHPIATNIYTGMDGH